MVKRQRITQCLMLGVRLGVRLGAGDPPGEGIAEPNREGDNPGRAFGGSGCREAALEGSAIDPAAEFALEGLSEASLEPGMETGVAASISSSGGGVGWSFARPASSRSSCVQRSSSHLIMNSFTSSGLLWMSWFMSCVIILSSPLSSTYLCASSCALNIFRGNGILLG
eukprot:CAMPEP_0171102174 /NCGR_PEP_ID=MMETSP0766_2-20121228/57072_1 /TAXON_ID=439317 /ORGANISM="Gambierdiscus australes, Strain CAWD 149" /LENGTH=167 /DNA_ID=CAMNT_0011562405 /DNA_START=81 /DNA_END=584 /DNA_ORIENTATION=+